MININHTAKIKIIFWVNFLLTKNTQNNFKIFHHIFNACKLYIYRICLIKRKNVSKVKHETHFCPRTRPNKTTTKPKQIKT